MEWVEVIPPESFSYTVRDMCMFDDGDGEKLYAIRNNSGLLRYEGGSSWVEVASSGTYGHTAMLACDDYIIAGNANGELDCWWPGETVWAKVADKLGNRRQVNKIINFNGDIIAAVNNTSNWVGDDLYKWTGTEWQDVLTSSRGQVSDIVDVYGTMWCGVHRWVMVAYHGYAFKYDYDNEHYDGYGAVLPNPNIWPIRFLVWNGTLYGIGLPEYSGNNKLMSYNTDGVEDKGTVIATLDSRGGMTYSSMCLFNDSMWIVLFNTNNNTCYTYSFDTETVVTENTSTSTKVTCILPVGNKLYGGSRDGGLYVWEVPLVVEDAIGIRINVGDEWKTGSAYINITDEWKPVIKAYINTFGYATWESVGDETWDTIGDETWEIQRVSWRRAVDV
jgi:hypothetical protein